MPFASMVSSATADFGQAAREMELQRIEAEWRALTPHRLLRVCGPPH